MNRQTAGRRRTASFAKRLALIAFVAAAFLPACGKKGPPLPPLVKAPARPEPFLARRLGSTVYLQFRIPTTNADATSPADIERVEVYGFTGTPADNVDIFKAGTLVASIPVRKPPEETVQPTSHRKAGRRVEKPEARPPAPPRPPASLENGFDQGDTIVVTEPLGPAQYVEVVPKTKKKAREIKAPPVRDVLRPLGPAPLTALPARVYVAVGINHKAQKGAPSVPQAVVLSAPASAPSAPTITYGETAFTITWTPPADAYPGAPAGDVLKSTPIGTRPILGAYNVYDVPPPPPGAARAPTPPAPRGQMPTPVNTAPIAAPPLVDKRIEFGKPRCYGVRVVTLFGTQSIEGELSPVQCVTPVDTFAPAAPISLKAVGSEGAISLIWDANTEPDLAGYLVMRATLPGGEFTRVTPGPIKETTFNDTTVTKGVHYAYVVVAVDVAKNISPRSNQVEESAR